MVPKYRRTRTDSPVLSIPPYAYVPFDPYVLTIRVHSLVNRLLVWLMHAGAFGLFALGVLDSSFLFLPRNRPWPGFIAKGLREQTYAVDVSTDGQEALYRAQINTYDLAILDVRLPKKDGFTVCRELRAGSFRAPVLMLTALDDPESVIRGLNCGADDYLASRSILVFCWRASGLCCGVARRWGPIG